jgi:hypothetical protein
MLPCTRVPKLNNVAMGAETSVKEHGNHLGMLQRWQNCADVGHAAKRQTMHTLYHLVCNNQGM